MGSGKSSVAVEISKYTNYKLIEVDELIIKNSNFESINEIFKNKGEPYFRTLEASAMKEASNSLNSIISCGGGAVTNPDTMHLLEKNSKVIYLKTDFEEINNRIGHMKDRPLFKDIDSAKELFYIREKLYQKYANLVIETNTKSIKEVSKEIIKRLSI
ncbi:UNVERIFIED_CONTAM: hypothetical protein GTU68_003046 [Idotea baltica]|nr:hypothetical protein [Idotea baltica]